ncbi:MAG: adenylyltransferase/cytidyltransferase family protein [Candidatus Levybacteria bacterium]|nr:adenylyltransferase/cytidyltransferase family protein [Candidatus Levybacteria bacterium]
MNKILNIDKAVQVSKVVRDTGGKLVLAGGCFDILHVGHIQFFERAKKFGDHLMLLIESDETVKRLKGVNRPINSQKNRARVLTALSTVDSVCLLPSISTNKAYESLVLRLKPAIIATTTGDLFQKQKEKQAKSVDGKVIRIKNLKDHSTTRIAQLLSQNL